jgi:hypothetical protein
MSRGWGKLQWLLFDLARGRFSDFDASQPWTFRQVCDARWPRRAKRLVGSVERRAERRAERDAEFPNLKGIPVHDDESEFHERRYAGRIRSMRRALQRLVGDRIILTIGGECDPRRVYIINPHVLNEDNPLRAKILAAFEADGVMISECGHFRPLLSAHTEHLDGAMA